MGETNGAAVRERSLAKGLIAGLIGGLAGTVARIYAERIFAPQPHARIEPVPTERSDGRIAGDTLTPIAKASPNPAIRWGYGAAVGAAYGALAEFYPDATAKQGASFGLALEALNREVAPHAPRLAAEPETQPEEERGSEITAHVAFGVATELVRRLVRRWL